jgi:hypothetical protein
MGGDGIFLFATAYRLAPIQKVADAYFSRTERPGGGNDHSLPSSDVVKNVWSHTFAFPYLLTV